MAIIMDKGCIEAIYGLMGWKELTRKCWVGLSAEGAVAHIYLVYH